MRSLTAVVVLCLASRLATAQGASVATEIRLGDSLQSALKPEAALAHFRAALAEDSTSYEALWKAARAQVDIAKQLEGDDDAQKKRRDSLYVGARALAEAAVRVNPKGADGHSMVAQALGRLSRTRGGKERVRFAKIIYDEAMQALALDSTNDPAAHVIGAWNAEIKRLSGIQRFFAKTLFGAGFMSKANWDDAQRYLERAVALRPQNIYHHLELAEIYVDVGKYSAARVQLKAVHDLPISDVLDHKYKEQAVLLEDDIKGEKDEG
jgi:tetratricopeptide (TPR) repeat protein